MLLSMTVSILVLVDVALERPDKDFWVLWHQVSILVLVDVALEQKEVVLKMVKELSFNPCFSGCCS